MTIWAAAYKTVLVEALLCFVVKFNITICMYENIYLNIVSNVFC